MNKKFLLFTLFFSVSIIFAEGERLFQLNSSEESETYLSLEVGSFTGLSLISKNIQLSGGYSFWAMEGFSISTDMLLFKPKINNFTLKTGVGGGIIFMPEIDVFTSYFYLRLPVRVNYNNIFLQAIPMIGTTMFEYELDWDFNFSITIGYQFDMYREKVEDDKKEEEKLEDKKKTP